MELSFWKAVILGLVQGLTEFLPISSSGHLVLFEHLLGVEVPGVTFEVVVHAGTLLAVLTAYRNEVGRLFNGLRPGNDPAVLRDRRLLLMVVLGTLPVVLAGLALKSHTDTLYSSIRFTGAGWIVTAALLFLVDRRLQQVSSATDSEEQLTAGRALAVGLLQAVALWPGISRSGSTIAAALLLGLGRQTAARFSFLLAIPVISGALILDLDNVIDLVVSAGPAASQWTAGLLAGFVAAVVSGYAAIHLLLRLLQLGRMLGFSIYCLLLGLMVLLAF